MTEQPVHNSDDSPTRWKRLLPFLKRLWRSIENFVFGFVLLLIIGYFVLQTQTVQNWLIAKVTHYLSDELKTKVEVKHINIQFFDHLLLEGFYVQDLQGDTLLYAERFSAGLNSNIFSLLGNRLEFNEINLYHARINLHRQEESLDYNLQFILDYFASDSKEPPSKPKPFTIKIQNLNLQDVIFEKFDKRDGKQLVFDVPRANIKVNKLDLPGKMLDVRSAVFEGFSLHVAEHPSKDWPEVPDTTGGGPPEVREPFKFLVNSFALTHGKFRLDKFDQSPGKQTRVEVMDYKHLNVFDIDIKADSVAFNDDLQFGGILRNLTAKEQCGFKLDHCEAGRVVVNDTITALYHAKLRSERGTSIGDSIFLHYHQYHDYDYFEKKVRMEVRFAPGSHVRLGDVMYFSENVAENPFFIQNTETIADITGLMDGTVNRLNGRNLDIRVGEGTIVQGEFDGNDMDEGSDRLQLLFRFSKLQSDIATISRIIPGFKAPEAVDKLGKIGFKGDYSIIFGNNHILNGFLITDIGAGKLDMKLDLSDGPEHATYSGKLNMNGFDLGAWTGDSNFGKTSFNLVIAEGSRGLTLPTVKATVTGVLDTFNFKGYSYKNVLMNGTFKERIFEGKMAIEDPNIDLHFDGTVNMRDSVTQFEFQTDVKRLDLRALNLLDQDWVLSGKVERIHLKAKDLDDLTGTVMLRNIRIVQDKQYIHQIDSIQLTSSIDLDNSLENRFVVHSDIADASFEGRFKLTNVLDNVIKLLQYYHPAFAHQLGGAPVDSIRFNDRYTMQVQIKDSKSLTRLLSEDLDTLRNINAVLRMDASKGIINARVDVPHIHYKNIDLKQIAAKVAMDQSNGQYDLSIPLANVSESTQLPPINLNGWVDRQQMGIKLLSRDTSKNASFVKGLNLDGVLSVADSLWQIRFNASHLALFNESWLINEDNFVRFGKGFFATKDFEFFNGNQRILLDSLNKGRGLAFSLTNFNLDFLNKVVDDESFKCRGKLYDFDFSVQDVFNMKGFSSFITSDTVFINDVPYGSITGNVDMENLTSPLTWKVFLNDNEHKLRLAGAFLPSGTEAVTVNDVGVTVKPGEFQTQVNAVHFPMSILEVFIHDISKVAGNVDVDARLGGKFDKIGMNGYAKIGDGQFQIDYLKSMFHIHNQRVDLSDTKIWADGDTVFDASNKNMALLKGGIRHDHLRKLSLDLLIESIGNNFMIINTLREDNPLYYGQGIGYFKAKFTGTFNQTNILVDAVTGAESRLFIPLGANSDVNDVTFIKFRDKNAPDSSQSKVKGFDFTEIKGLNFEMNLSITQDAETQLIFDERTGDIIKGRGDGDIKLLINREGDFKMYGTYQIKHGEYLFTMLNFVKKPFTVADGGTINWSGDPYSAVINLNATYEETTPIYNLIRDDIQLTGNNGDDAQKGTKAIVTMHMKGDLLKPIITFDLDFPNVTGQTKTLVDNKLRLLRQDPNELNRQVFGLVVVGAFLPSNSNQFLQSSDYLASGLNTLTQVLSNQFSNYLTGLVSEAFGGKISSIDVNIVFNEYQNSILNGPDYTGRELQLRLSSGLANDRIKVQVGSQFNVGNQPTASLVPQDGFLGEDVTVEIMITPNRQWLVKVYQRLEPDVVAGPKRLKYGVGLSFRKEFDMKKSQ